VLALAHAPEADSSHGQQVIQAQHGVQKAAHKSAFGVARVGHGGGGSSQQRASGEEFGCEFHGFLLMVLKSFVLGWLRRFRQASQAGVPATCPAPE